MAVITLNATPKIDMTQVATPEQVSALEQQITSEMLAGLIDHTNLFPWATHDDIVKLCEEASRYETATVCVNEGRVQDAKAYLDANSSLVKVCCVVGFPLGAAATTIKAFSAIDAIRAGAEEVDMVINIASLKEKKYDAFYDDIVAVTDNVARYNEKNRKNIVLKVIQENCYLTDDEIYFASSAIARIAVAYRHLKVFAKTSTGFGTPAKGPVPKKDYGAGLVNCEVGATVYDVALMRRAIDEITPLWNAVGIKAAGGIRDRDIALKMMCAAGCLRYDDEKGYVLRENYRELFRIGASATESICR